DGIGAYRTQDQGQAIDTSGALDDAPFQTLPELVALLKKDARTGDCLIRQLFRFVSGHEHLTGEDGVLAGLRPQLAAKPDFLDLLVAMVTSDWFRFPAPAL